MTASNHSFPGSRAIPVPVFDIPTVEVAGTAERFPVRRIYCVGQNYPAHAREMGSTPERAPPFFFMKPADAVFEGGQAVPFPPRTGNLHHEVELVLALGGGGRDVDAAEADALIFGYCVGLDLTRRDLQAEAKSRGRPWDMAKGFDHSAPLAPLSRMAPPPDAAIELRVNGERRQSGRLSDMTWSPAEILSILSSYVTLRPGDLIFSGTPAGVGPVRPGDRLQASVAGLPPLDIRIG